MNNNSYNTKYLTSNPSFHIDALNEPFAPASGSGDESPTNLAVQSDEYVEQTTAINQPVWEGDHWETNADDTNASFWMANDLAANKQNGKTWIRVYVVRRDDNGTAYLHRDGDGANARIRLRYNPNSNSMGPLIEDVNGVRPNFGTFTSDANPPGVKEIIGYGFSVRGTTLESVTFASFQDGVNRAFDTVNPADYEYNETSLFAISSGAGSFDGKVYEVLQFRQMLSDNQIENFLLPALKKKHNITDASNTPRFYPNARSSLELPEEPSLWISGKDEIEDHNDGDPIRKPSNLNPSNQFIEQAFTTNQPTWNEAEQAWDDGFDDRWDVTNFPKTLKQITVAAVVKNNNETNSGNAYFYSIRDNTDISQIYLSFRDTDAHQLSLTDDTTNSLFIQAGKGGSDPVDNLQYCIVVVSFDIESGEVRMYNTDGTSINYITDTYNLGSITKLEGESIGDYVGNLGSTDCSIKELIKFPKALDQEEIELSLLPYLSHKHGIDYPGRPEKPLSTRTIIPSEISEVI